MVVLVEMIKWISRLVDHSLNQGAPNFSNKVPHNIFVIFLRAEGMSVYACMQTHTHTLVLTYPYAALPPITCTLTHLHTHTSTHPLPTHTHSHPLTHTHVWLPAHMHAHTDRPDKKTRWASCGQWTVLWKPLV